mmetsp:Transcript_7578/g.16964  ORF Transcript_7578/g.16964 Transcript_7578/m.16964 type:complete len:211 (+) Transcript_7578:1724-2356(+)
MQQVLNPRKTLRFARTRAHLLPRTVENTQTCCAGCQPSSTLKSFCNTPPEVPRALQRSHFRLMYTRSPHSPRATLLIVLAATCLCSQFFPREPVGSIPRRRARLCLVQHRHLPHPPHTRAAPPTVFPISRRNSRCHRRLPCRKAHPAHAQPQPRRAPPTPVSASYTPIYSHHSTVPPSTTNAAHTRAFVHSPPRLERSSSPTSCRADPGI